MVSDTGKGVIPESMQLVAGRTGQEYNLRKSRKGAFWEDRYHATIVQTNRHFLRCMIYIDLNMVRAGVVTHPSEWEECGYNEILCPPARYSLIDREALKKFLGFSDEEAMKSAYQEHVAEALRNELQVRQWIWTESIAVGDADYVTEVKRRLSSMAKGRKIIAGDDVYELRELTFPYCGLSNAKNNGPRLENTFAWENVNDESNV
jgi:hypothetical protein